MYTQQSLYMYTRTSSSMRTAAQQHMYSSTAAHAYVQHVYRIAVRPRQRIWQYMHILLLRMLALYECHARHGHYSAPAAHVAIAKGSTAK